MPRLGITRLGNVTGLDVIGVPVVMAVRPNSRGLSVTQGKGLTLDAAKASALMEAVEAYHAENISLPLKLGTFTNLQKTHEIVDPFALHTGESGPFVPDRPLLWIEAVNLIDGTNVWLPYDLVHTDFTYESRLGRGMFDVTSNGLASGNTRLEAISHALCEVIERDSTGLWSAETPEMQQVRRVDLETVDDVACRALLDQLQGANMDVVVWDTTTDIGLPCFVTMIAERIGRVLRLPFVTQGMGCHPRRGIALMRALTESIQSRTTLIAGSRDDVFRSDYHRLSDPQAYRQVLTLLDQDQPRRFTEAPDFNHDSFLDDVLVEVRLLAECGMNVVAVVDLSQEEIGLSVVRVVVPGLESYISHDRYRPGPRARRRI